MTQQKEGPEQETLILFPCLFPIKIMGKKLPTLRIEIIDIINQHAPGFIEETMLTERESSKGNYLSFTATVHATSKAQLDRIYQALTDHPHVKVVL